MHDLHERWNRLWDALGAQGSPDALFNELSAAYEAPARAYHNLHHIEASLDELERSEYLAEQPREIELAIWFHDLIYDTHRHDNESRSATKAMEAIRASKMRHITEAAVQDLIMATRHDAAPATNDGRLIADIDLAILGDKADRFDAYETAIRKEFAWVDEAHFKNERAKVLNHFLQQPHIYHTAMFRGKYEANARANLQRSLVQLNTNV